MFSGSYASEDVTFLLKPVQIESTEIAEKERLIQSGRRHYSEMITYEDLPPPRYLETFYQAFDQEKARLARHLIALAQQISAARQGEIVLVSLARAGTPIGVLLNRLLRSHLRREVKHYSISIIRDRGIDAVALCHILKRHEQSSVVFVDGWTGKGVIAKELHQAITRFNQQQQVALDPGLYAVADLCGMAAAAATTEDYLIPCCILGATISGLVSRSILNRAVVGPDDFHGCLYYEEFTPHDLSRWFADRMMEEIDARLMNAPTETERPPKSFNLIRLRQKSQEFLTNIKQRFGIHNINHIKPGIGEATRVLLRRAPQLLLLQSTDLPETAHLQLLAKKKKVPMQTDANLLYRAAAVIKELV